MNLGQLRKEQITRTGKYKILLGEFVCGKLNEETIDFFNVVNPTTRLVSKAILACGVVPTAAP